jgi:uncharacterized protein (DUF433 family)
MPIQVAAQLVPLVVGEDGVVRVRGTRVTLDTLVDAHRSGATADEIAQQYPTVGLADVYAIVAFYLHHLADDGRNRSHQTTSRIDDTVGSQPSAASNVRPCYSLLGAFAGNVRRDAPGTR